LVRDKIIDNLSNKNISTEYQILISDADFHAALTTKLKEEVDEYIADNNEAELADIVEVIKAIMQLKNISEHALEKTRLEKLAKNGGFEKRIYLKTTSEKYDKTKKVR